MQQSHHLIHHQGTKSKKPYATVPLCHCATAPLRLYYSPYLCIVKLERFKRDASTMQRPRLKGAKPTC